ncbi:MAG: response regulator [Candidatus Omnitrophota bacterium]
MENIKKEKRKVMLVDDEVAFLSLMKLNLQERGNYAVLTLSNARDIISKVHSFKPDIIILDMIMPHIGGLEVCQMLNDDPVGERIPLIILSALSKDLDRLKAYKLGVLDYITKPVNTDMLISKIERIFSSR